MRALFIFLFTMTSLVSCKDEKIEEKIKGVAKIEFMSYPDRIAWDNDVKKGENIMYREIVKNGMLDFDSTLVRERIVLNESQQEALATLLEKNCLMEEPAAACYMPRHIIVYRDKKDKIIGYQEFCFTCVGSRNSKNMEKYNAFCMSDMEQLFRETGIKYFVDTPQREKEEYKFLDSLELARNKKRY